MNPDDLADFREDCTRLLVLLQDMDLSSEFSDNVIGSTFYKVAAMKVLRCGINLESFLALGESFYLTIEEMLAESDNELLNDSKQENPNENEEDRKRIESAREKRRKER